MKGYKFEYNDVKLKEKYKRSPFKKKTNKKVIQIIDNNEIIHNSLKECSEYNNISDSFVSMILSGKRDKKNKYNLHYYDDYKIQKSSFK